MVTAALVVFGSYYLLIGLYMIFFPGTFFATVGNFGVRNDHYTFDNASFSVPLGLMLLTAVRWPSWRVPALAFATVQSTIHSVSHLIDPHHGAGELVGWLESGSLVFTTVILALALRAAVR